IHQALYPWLYNFRFQSIADLVKSSHGRGIVICVGNSYFKLVRSTIDTFRNVLHTDLPIEIFYIGDEDLSEDNRKILKEYKDVYIEDITTYFDNEKVNIGGWAVKPFAILASRFEEVILIDADVIYLHEPALLFDDPGYKQTGTLFFQDRTISPGPHPGSKWLKSWMIDPLPETRNLRFWKEETIHEMESSTVVIHKIRNILGLLTVCKLNEKVMRNDVVYKYVYGDKETFWMGFDMAREHYHVNPIPCSYIGNREKDDEGKKFCGHIGHSLSNGKFMFWNGHLIKDKNKSSFNDERSLIHFDSYYIDDNIGEWNSDLTCLKMDKKPVKLIPLSEDESNTLNTILSREKKYHFIISNN
ncbi:hypothetical protein LY90DRAFT_435416, partial [Neocallimastix californiae]